MQKVIIKEKEEKTVFLDDIRVDIPIFAKKNGKLAGMLIKEPYGHPNSNMWILRLGGATGSTGYHTTRQQCIDSCIQLGYEFYVDL